VTFAFVPYSSTLWHAPGLGPRVAECGPVSLPILRYARKSDASVRARDAPTAEGQFIRVKTLEQLALRIPNLPDNQGRSYGSP
jgi:hypothetical protein